MANKECELCTNPARMFCESDEASLCWDCDHKVHGANFLVAKHSRSLLCHVCFTPTPWKAAGEKLGPTVSVCQACADRGDNRAAATIGFENEDGADSISHESDTDDGEYFSDTDDVSEDEDGEDGENQVVPWSISDSNSPLPPAPATSSSSEEYVTFSSLKRTRDNIFESEDEDGCCSSHLDSKLGESDENCESPSLSLYRSFKMRRRSTDSLSSPSEPAAAAEGEDRVKPSSSTAAIIEQLRRLEQEIVNEGGDPSAMVLGLCKLTRN